MSATEKKPKTELDVWQDAYCRLREAADSLRHHALAFGRNRPIEDASEGLFHVDTRLEAGLEAIGAAVPAWLMDPEASP